MSMREVTKVRPITAVTSGDGSTKYLWRLSDGQSVESVYLPLMNRGAEGPSMCISSQVGCAVRCIFCATGQNGLMRNLQADEIAGQVHGMIADLEAFPDAFDVSFMGMGEPLHNLSAVRIAIEELLAAYSDRCEVHFSLSTIGIARKIYDLAEIDTPISLQVSLHSTTDEVRAQLIPTRSRTTIDALLAAARYYADVKKDSVNINYVLFDGVNDTVESAIRLTEMIGGDPRLRLKLSHYNPIEGSDLNPASEARKRRFITLCQERGLNTFAWESMALDVSGGCGQLRSANGSRGPLRDPAE